MFKKIGAFVASILLLSTSIFAEELVSIDKFKGLVRSPDAGKIEDGAHTNFNDVFIEDGNIRTVKGRNRLNSTAHSDAVVNMLCYYENGAGTTKKLIVKESDEVVTYDIDGTNRVSIASTLTNEKADCAQIGDTLYFSSSTDGLYKWTGTGSASAISGVSAPSSVDFEASGYGGLTAGHDALVACGATTTENVSNTSCGSLSSGFVKSCATNAEYFYKVSKYSSVWGIESEPSSSDTAALLGRNTVDADCDTTAEDSVLVSGGQTATTGTLASAPATPFDSYRVYRTTSGGSDFFLAGQQTTGAFVDGKPDLALSDPLDTTIDTISPPSYRYVTEYKGTLFLAEGDILYFTRLPISAVANADSYWLESDKLTTGVKKPIRGLHSTSNSLIIFSENKIQELSGFGVTSFKLRTLVEDVGTVSDETIEADNNGNLFFFAGVQGVYKLTVDKSPIDDLLGTGDQSRMDLIRVSSPNLDNVFLGVDSSIDLDPTDYSNAHAYFDKDNDLYFLFVGSDCLIFDVANNSWSHLPAAKMSASVFRRSPNTEGQGVLLDTVGFFFNNWKGYENGIESGTVTGNPTSSASTTLTCSTCTFNITGDGLKGLWIVVDESDVLQYRQISSNTGTQITVTSAWDNNPTTSSTFYIAYIVADWKTKMFNVKLPSELEALAATLIHNKAASAQNIEMFYFINKSSTPKGSFPFDLATNFIDKKAIGVRSPWVQLGFRSFVYNTSETVTPPVDVQAYTLHAVSREAE